MSAVKRIHHKESKWEFTVHIDISLCVVSADCTSQCTSVGKLHGGILIRFHVEIKDCFALQHSQHCITELSFRAGLTQII